MSVDYPVCGAAVPVRVPCGTHGCAFGPSKGLVGRLDAALDALNVLAWPILTTAASLLPHRVSGWIRPSIDPHTEADILA